MTKPKSFSKSNKEKQIMITKTHSAIKIEINAGKIISDLLTKYKK